MPANQLDRLLRPLGGPKILTRVGTISDRDGGIALYPEEAACVTRAVPKRKREFAFGRSLARDLLSELGMEPGPLLPDRDRCPIWPEPAMGSISHSSKFCAVVASTDPGLRGLGIDVEFSETLAANLRDRICLPEELDGLEGERAGRRAKLLFSIKEAVYKCQFPLTRIRFDFHDVHVELEPSRFSATLRVGRAAAAAAQVIQGRYMWDGDHVFTAATLPA